MMIIIWSYISLKQFQSGRMTTQYNMYLSSEYIEIYFIFTIRSIHRNIKSRNMCLFGTSSVGKLKYLIILTPLTVNTIFGDRVFQILHVVQCYI